jgi:hypothetical protein
VAQPLLFGLGWLGQPSIFYFILFFSFAFWGSRSPPQDKRGWPICESGLSPLLLCVFPLVFFFFLKKKKREKKRVSGGCYVCGFLFPLGLGPVVELCFLLAFRAMELWSWLLFLFLFSVVFFFGFLLVEASYPKFPTTLGNNRNRLFISRSSYSTINRDIYIVNN